jgi:hypothetical protein
VLIGPLILFRVHTTLCADDTVTGVIPLSRKLEAMRSGSVTIGIDRLIGMVKQSFAVIKPLGSLIEGRGGAEDLA